MKAAVYQQYGAPEVLEIREIEKTTPKDNEIRIKIHATAVNSGDCRLRSADPFAVRFFFGLFKPKKSILGGVLSGEVESVGKDVTLFKPGNLVFGATQLKFGAYAEYLCLPENGALAIKPANISHAEAAALPFGGLTAWHFLQKANIQPGQKVLIYGASGAVGSAAVQIARYLGAEVTGVCSGANAEMVKSLGASEVIDYTKRDFSQSETKYDLLYETVNKAPVSACVAALKSKGTLILGAGMLPEMMQAAWVSRSKGIKVLSGMCEETRAGVEFLQKMAAEGKLKAVVDREYPLEQISAAHHYVEKGHKKGNVLIRLQD